MTSVRTRLLGRVGRIVRRVSPMPQIRRAVHRPRWGNLRRMDPFSAEYGFDRGTPIDRVYIRRFLATHQHRVRGVVLEVKDATYTRHFGGDDVAESHVVDIDPRNPHATLVADLGSIGSLPARTFDCVILTQTLQLIPDAPQALRNAWDALAPGGALLVTVPTTTKVEGAYPDLWRWTPAGFAELVARALPDATATINGHGNLVTTVAFLHGLAAQELDAAELIDDDPTFPMLVVAEILKGPGR